MGGCGATFRFKTPKKSDSPDQDSGDDDIDFYVVCPSCSQRLNLAIYSDGSLQYYPIKKMPID